MLAALGLLLVYSRSAGGRWVAAPLGIAAGTGGDDEAKVAELTGSAERQGECHTAVVGEECYEHVIWAMTTGINEFPEKYEHLTMWSSFREFQAVISQVHESCSAPCWGWEGKLCHTAEIGEECYRHVGQYMQGARFPSSFEEVQEKLRVEGDVTCALPCFKNLAARAGRVKDRAVNKAKKLFESTPSTTAT